jgi:hypothetical protein
MIGDDPAGAPVMRVLPGERLRLASPGDDLATPAAPGPDAPGVAERRPYVPLHELRRRFSLNGDDDDVVPIAANGDRLYVGLPEREAHLLEELLRQAEVGYQCSLDPPSPIIVGVYPMRPVPRS